MPLLVGFSHFCLFFSHLSSNLSISRSVWQDSLAGQIGTAAWQNTWPPLAGRNFGRKGLNFGRMKLLAPLKNDPDKPMYILFILTMSMSRCCWWQGARKQRD